MEKKYCHTEGIMLVPQYNWSNESKKENEEIEKYILEQDQFHAQLSLGDVLELEDIDMNLDWLGNVTVGELIMKFPKKSKTIKNIFIVVEKRLNG